MTTNDNKPLGIISSETTVLEDGTVLTTHTVRRAARYSGVVKVYTQTETIFVAEHHGFSSGWCLSKEEALSRVTRYLDGEEIYATPCGVPSVAEMAAAHEYLRRRRNRDASHTHTQSLVEQAIACGTNTPEWLTAAEVVYELYGRIRGTFSPSPCIRRSLPTPTR